MQLPPRCHTLPDSLRKAASRALRSLGVTRFAALAALTLLVAITFGFTLIPTAALAQDDIPTARPATPALQPDAPTAAPAAEADPGAGSTIQVTGAAKVDIQVQSISGTEGSTATTTLMTDLSRSQLINPTTTQAKYSATAQLGSGGLVARLTDTANGRVLVNKTYSGAWRDAVHQFADDITFATTGIPGFASSKIAFVSNSTGSKELYIMDIDGHNVRQLTSDRTISSSPAWSRDNTMLAYTSYKSGYPDVYIIKLATGQRTRVAYFPGINSGAAFSPDGTRLALTLSKDGNPELYIMPITGGGNNAAPVRLTRTRGAETSPSWSPTGDRIVFCSDDRGSPQLFITSSTPGGNTDRLSLNSTFTTEPDWSPDGRKITYTLRAGGLFQIGVYDMAVRNSVQCTTTGGQDSNWTRDSRHVVYTNNGQIYLLDTVTRQSTLIRGDLKGCGEVAVSK
ncbi:MAG: DPP IV N-terminal domain-containing protein [Candidatus Methylacidiphilales bacterium]|nr:DPP IV N-terminal domain-containing protein [Candidatus Methylacidiphilales bacterium]